MDKVTVARHVRVNGQSVRFYVVYDYRDILRMRRVSCASTACEIARRLHIPFEE